MRLAVIGRAGQLAQALQAAPRAGDMSLETHGRPDIDLTRPDTLSGLFAPGDRPDLVINAAAYTNVDQAETDVDAAFALNRDGAGGLARLCAANGVPLIHISTDYVFDGSKHGPYTEQDPTRPLGVYGRSKLEGEEVVRAAGCHHVILRTAWVISPYGRNFVISMLRLMAERERLGVVDDQIGCPTSAIDLANAITGIAAQLGDVSGTYHLTGAGRTSWYGLAGEIQRQAGEIFGTGWRGSDCIIEPIPTSAYPTPARRPANSVLSNEAFGRRFGFTLPDWCDSLPEILSAVAQQKEA